MKVWERVYVWLWSSDSWWYPRWHLIRAITTLAPRVGVSNRHLGALANIGMRRQLKASKATP